MQIAPWMLSCAERAAVRAEMLARWARTDWGGSPRVHLDAGEEAPADDNSRGLQPRWARQGGHVA